MDNTDHDMGETLITLTSDIVAAHVSNNNVSAEDVSALIKSCLLYTSDAADE